MVARITCETAPLNCSTTLAEGQLPPLHTLYQQETVCRGSSATLAQPLNPTKTFRSSSGSGAAKVRLGCFRSSRRIIRPRLLHSYPTPHLTSRVHALTSPARLSATPFPTFFPLLRCVEKYIYIYIYLKHTTVQSRLRSR